MKEHEKQYFFLRAILQYDLVPSSPFFLLIESLLITLSKHPQCWVSYTKRTNVSWVSIRSVSKQRAFGALSTLVHETIQVYYAFESIYRMLKSFFLCKALVHTTIRLTSVKYRYFKSTYCLDWLKCQFNLTTSSWTDSIFLFSWRKKRH